jgi:phosphoribosylaminoimidazolecarboxamide formyltransferase/IMP cyclohydrolase
MPFSLISLSNKAGVQDFSRELVDLGWNLLASGGTADYLKSCGIPVIQISDYTGVPEILSGRVKTLHPKIFGGILARAEPNDLQDLERLAASLIDMVVVNLYPFREIASRPGVQLAEAVENIDIGGVALIRAAAKNYHRTAVVSDPGDYQQVLDELESFGKVSLTTRHKLAVKAFRQTAAYDSAIQQYLASGVIDAGENLDPLELRLYPILPLRYGENPHQEAVLYADQPADGPLGGELLQGKPLSYNNLLDLDAAWRAALAYEKATIVIVKHLSPCGIASAETLAKAYGRALASDPISAFGGVIAANQELDGATAQAMEALFIECIAAPGFSADALEILRTRKSVRLLQVPKPMLSPRYEFRSIQRGILRQTVDLGDPGPSGFSEGSLWKIVSRRSPTEAEKQDLVFAWRACQHVKSNAIVFAKDEATVGIGGGQPNRVDCVRIAAERAGDGSRGAVMASDAFFPFPDSVEEAARAGITAVIQPGGSVRDQAAIIAADAHNMVMVFTGSRHFRH